MQLLKITVHRPCSAKQSRSAAQVRRSYRGQQGITDEQLDALDRPTVTLDVPEVTPNLWFPVILQLLPEDVSCFEVVDLPVAPGQLEQQVLPRIWVVRDGENWHESVRRLPEDSPLRLAGAEYWCQPSNLRHPTTLHDEDRILFVSDDWKTFDIRTPDGRNDPRFPRTHLDPTDVAEEAPAA